MNKYLKQLGYFAGCLVKNPRVCLEKGVIQSPASYSAYRFAQAYRNGGSHAAGASLPAPANPLRHYSQSLASGRGLWKWEHYFDIYHRHFSRFVGEQVDVMEIGIYGGGSLDMWRSYFGPLSHIYGVDIEAACQAYENDHVSVLIGDQADRSFWGAVKQRLHGLDIIIDDGGHTPEQQQTTLEEMLPFLRPGGVYLCEDVHGDANRFAAFATGLVAELNRMTTIPGPLYQSRVTPFQSSIHSIHFYPYVVVIEKHREKPAALTAPRRGTEWPTHG